MCRSPKPHFTAMPSRSRAAILSAAILWAGLVWAGCLGTWACGSTDQPPADEPEQLTPVEPEPAAAEEPEPLDPAEPGPAGAAEPQPTALDEPDTAGAQEPAGPPPPTPLPPTDEARLPELPRGLAQDPDLLEPPRENSEEVLREIAEEVIAESELAGLVSVVGWQQKLLRDARLKFTRNAARVAGEALDKSLRMDKPYERSAALLTLGAGGAVSELPRLEAWSLEGGPMDREAAILGLGLLGETPPRFFLDIAAADPVLSHVVMLALALSEREDCRAWVREISRNSDDPYSAPALHALTFTTVPDASTSFPAGEVYLELRWQAARRYGLVDDQSFDTLYVRELSRNDDFIDHVVLLSAAELTRPGVRDHVIEQLLREGGSAAVRAAIVLMPTELAALVQAGIWRPSTPREWAAVVLQISVEDNADQLVDLLKLAGTEPVVSAEAGGLLLGLGIEEAFVLLEGDLLSEDPRDRMHVARALGQSDDPAWIGELERMLLDPDSKVAASARVAQLRLAHPDAVEHVRGLMRINDDERTEDETEELKQLILAMCRDAILDRKLAKWLEEGLQDSSGDAQLRAATELVLAGRIGPREIVREALVHGEGGPLRARMVEALSINPNSEDLEALRSIFPDQTDLALNVGLARILIRHRDSKGLLVLRAAIWRGPWNRSVLASAILVERSGIHSLHEELAAPPRHARRSDLRRLGFAIGLWGGVDEVEAMARGRRSGDPALQGAFLGAMAARTLQ